MRTRLDRGRWWLAGAIGVAALVAGGTSVFLSLSDGSSGESEKAFKAEVPLASGGDVTAPGGDEPSVGGKKADGNERQDPPAEPSPTRGGQPNEFLRPPRGTKHSNRPVPDPPPVRKPNRRETKPPPVRQPNRYGGQPAEE